jgi:hypothetical protein
MDPKRVKSIIQFPIPQNLRDVRSFLGLAGYHRQFVNHWSDMAEPLTRLTRKNIPFYWSDEQNDAFNKIKAAISQEPVLIHYNPELETILKSDASGYAVGAKLEQKLNGKFHPVTHASRMMTKTEKTNYCISEKECLAIVYATNKFRHYLIGLKFVIITDHLPLKWLASKQNLSARLIQWALHLSQFDYTVEYKSGRLHKDVDALSRYPVDSPESEIDNMERYSYALTSEQISNDDILNLKELQKNDENFKSIYKIIDEDIDTPDNKIKSDYTINDGILYKLQKVNDKEKLVVCLPKKLWFDVLYTYHDDIYSGHLGFERTLDKIRSRFYFPDMRNFIEIYCQSCEDCSTGKVPTTPKAGLMMPICTEGPGEIIALDFLGPIPISDMGNKWIIVGTDAFTKYAEVRAFPTDKQEDVVKFYVENIVCRFGVPKVLLSDRGSQFRSQLSKAIFQLMGSSPVNTTAYHPQTNGVTERFNKTLALMLKMYCNKSQSIWCKGLPHVVFAYNTSKHSTTGYSPYYLTFNREPVLPADRNLKVISTGYPSVDDYVFELSSTMKLVREITKNRIKNAGLYNKSVYDKKHRHVEYKPNDLVWIYYPKRKIGKAEKLLHYFHGPFKVIEKTSAVNYNVQNTKGKKLIIDKVHVSRMKPCYSREKLFKILEVKKNDDNSDETIIQENHSEVSDNDLALNNESPPNQVKQEQEVESIDSDETEIYSDWIDPEIREIMDKTDDERSRQNYLSRLQTPPRRSQRIKKPTNFYHAMSLFMVFCVIFQVSLSSFQKSNPILWYKSSKPVITGVNRVLINVKFNSPCVIFKEPPLSVWRGDELFDWCDQQFQSDFIEPLMNFCEIPERIVNPELALQRTKRLAFVTMGIIALITVAVSTTVGVTTS